MVQIAKHYATIKNPTIAAAVGELFRFNTEKEAQAQLRVLERFFVTSRKQLTKSATPSIHLWIKGYGLEAGEEEAGTLGHFAIISYRKRDGRYVLFATKLHAPAKDHPERTQPKRDNPNLGHPIIRAAMKGKLYPTFEAAQAELVVLHEAFPKVSIPNSDKIYIMIYCGTRPPKERMVKFVIEITPENGQHKLSMRENSIASKAPRTERLRDTEAPVGKFTQRVKLGKRRKK